MRIFFSTGEVSGDRHAAQILSHLKKLFPSLDAFGMGGVHLRKAGLRCIVQTEDMQMMGFSEVLSRLPKVFQAYRKLLRSIHETPPDLILVTDFPDFHFLLARGVQRLNIPLIYFIPPKVWAWRKGRIHFLKKRFTRLLCILPFEEVFYRAEGLSVKYVGCPLVEELPLSLTREEARKTLGLSLTEKVVVALPGSRSSEIKQHLEVMVEAARLVAEKMNTPIQLLIPLPEGRLAPALPEFQSSLLQVVFSQGNSDRCLVAADAGLIKSGTSTLEASLLNCPHVIVYRPSRSSAWIFKHLIRYRGPVGLPNLILKALGRDSKEWIPEILSEEVTSERLSRELVSMLSDPSVREARLNANALVKAEVCRETSPSQACVREIREVLSW